MTIVDLTGYYRAMNDEGVMGWYNPITKHFIIPVDVMPEES